MTLCDIDPYETKIGRYKAMDEVLWHEETNVNDMQIKLENLRALYSETKVPIEDNDMIIWIMKNQPEICSNTVDCIPIWHKHKHPGEQPDFDIYKMYINRKY